MFVVVPVAEDDGELFIVDVGLFCRVDYEGGAQTVDVLAGCVCVYPVRPCLARAANVNAVGRCAAGGDTTKIDYD